MRNIFKNFLLKSNLKGKVNILVNSLVKEIFLPVNNPENPF